MTLPIAPLPISPPSLAPNPLREGLTSRKAVDPCTVVVLGATGDLTARKLMPALYALARAGHLPSRYAVVGFARRPKSDDEFCDEVFSSLHEFARYPAESRADASSFLSHVFYQKGEFNEASHFEALRQRLETIERDLGLSGNRLFYLATAPEYFESILDHFQTSGLARPADPALPFTRLIVEKPFGTDLDSAQKLNRVLLRVFDESQVFRIDHYLGKETVQNILAFRFANSIFEPLWSSRYVDHVQITVAEEVGMPGRRGQYFDTAGMMRDVVQNHVLQLLCLTAMEPPASLDGEALRDEKVRLLRAIKPMTVEEVAENTVRGQYAAGSIGGKPVPAYREENEVPRDSNTETWVAVRFHVRNWRWSGVPFLLRAGKRMPKRATEIAVTFKAPPHQIFPDLAPEYQHNTLLLRIQPDEGISLGFVAKRPGLTSRLQPVKMDFRYGLSFGEASPEAYERLLLDAMVGDAGLFTRADEVELSWRLITAIHEGWAAGPKPDFPNYEAGTWGPLEADRLTRGVARGWRRL